MENIDDKIKNLELEDGLEIEDYGGFYNSKERTNESIEQEENVNEDFLRTVQQNTEKILQKKENQKTEKKSMFNFGKKRNKKQPKGVINISDIESEDSDDIIIIGASSKKVKRATKTTLKTIFALTITGLLAIVVLLCLTYKLVPANVEGANYQIGDYSIVANEATPNLNNLKSGDKVIVNKNSWSPIVVDFKLYKIKSRDGGLMHAINEQGYDETLETTEVSYILKQ